MNIDEYQEAAWATARFRFKNAIGYCALQLASEAGEVAGKVAKITRDEDRDFDQLHRMSQERCEAILKEIGDVLWYASALSRLLGYTLSEVAEMNLDKLAGREARGTLAGSGDDR